MSVDSNRERSFLKEVQFSNLLSFGPNNVTLPLKQLNVLIGPNGAGKSNLIEALALMRATPVMPQTTSNADVRGVLRRGGGTTEWLWKGAKDPVGIPDLVINYPDGEQALRHHFAFRGDSGGFQMVDERIENEKPYRTSREARYYYRHHYAGRPILDTVVPTVAGTSAISTGKHKDRVPTPVRSPMDLNVSILAQLRDPDRYPEITYLAQTYEKWRIYREWSFGRNTVCREPQKTDEFNVWLKEDFSNLGLILSKLSRKPKAKKAILDHLRGLYAGLIGFETYVEGGTVQVFFTEGDFSIPATRLSDGTLHYLCLLAILCDPNPPPLICIEEPELGLHPDLLPKLADLLKEASDRTQIIVTTHSDILVDAMTETPEYVVVCEKHEGCTSMSRLSKKALAGWLAKYRLGQLWIDGQLGGKRW